jgi:cellulose synthase/poly-beta-1,6-N-acetylglucosamine synthase-like glycosyltransferase
VRAAVDSLLNQTYPRLEVILVNDGSIDNTAEVLRSYSESDERVKFLDIAHAGTSGAKNSGYKQSKGDVIFFAEGDAVYTKEYVAKAVACLSSGESIGGVCVLGGPLVERQTLITKSMKAEKLVMHKLIAQGKMKPYYAWVFPRQVLENVGLYDTHLSQAEDRDLFNRVKRAGYSIGLVQGMLWYHRRNETTWQFAKTSYRKGKRRIAYIAKNGRVKEFVKGVGALWGSAILLVLGIFDVSFVWLLLAVGIVGFAYRTVSTFYLGQGTGASHSSLLLVPIFQMIRYFSNAFGYTAGLFNFVRKATA